MLLTPSVSAAQGAAQGAPQVWENLAPGLDYRQFFLTTPNQVYVVRMERTNPALIIDTTLAQGRMSGATETTRAQAARYDGTLNTWNHQAGQRSKVMVAINGSFFNMQTGQIDRGVIQSGWYAKRFFDGENGSGFAWKYDRSAFIGECVAHPSGKQSVEFADNAVQLINGVNAPRAADQLIVYTPQYGRDTGTDASGAEVLVEMLQPTGIVSPTTPAGGVIREIRRNLGATPIPFGHVVLSAQGTARATLLAHAAVGDWVGIAQKIKNCTNQPEPNWSDTYASLGGSFYFLKNNVIQSFNDVGAYVRNPRTAIAYNNDYLYFIVVDGRNPGVSVGMTMPELGDFAKSILGATNGINQDGGGSSTMVINGQVMNNTYCNNVFCDATVNNRHIYLPLLIEGSSGMQQSARRLTLGGDDMQRDPSNIPTPSPGGPAPEDEDYHPELWDRSAGTVERMVANGWIIAVVEPKQQSITYAAGAQVRVAAAARVWLGPGVNYAVLDTAPAGATGTVVSHPGGLNGVLASGAYWWRVDFGNGLSGWVTEGELSPLR